MARRSAAQAVGKVRRVLESAQGSVQSRLGSARDQATETWDNLEALVQNRVQMALHQIGVPTLERDPAAHEAGRGIERRDVKALSARPGAARREGRARAKRKAAGTGR